MPARPKRGSGLARQTWEPRHVAITIQRDPDWLARATPALEELWREVEHYRKLSAADARAYLRHPAR